jgi:Heterokaryon incompatibility protein (HET)
MLAGESLFFKRHFWLCGKLDSSTMRLLEIGERGELSFTKDLKDNIPTYTILSHTWGREDEEVDFNDLKTGFGKDKQGYLKIRFCQEQAHNDGIHNFWVDTCCIDKSSSTELATAIVSMYQWYRNAAKCYVFLSDVSTRKRDNEGSKRSWEPAFRKSRWFTRGWTLQELLAPTSVEFFSREGVCLGDKRTLEQTIHEITSIPIEALRGAPLDQFPVHERVRWQEQRQVTIEEDRAYCLLGIFEVFMHPLYGEGKNAFVRLNDEIAKSYRKQLDLAGHAYISSTPHSFQKHDPDSAFDDTEGTASYDRQKMLLASLSFDQMDSRRSTIQSAYATTCQWLLQHPAYLDWIDSKKLEEHYGFLWVNGKPGAGKSTLIKFAHACADKKRSDGEILISYFFNARGEELERSTVGMYRALLFQLLDRAPHLQKLLDDLYSTSKYQSKSPTWTVESLCELLSAAISKLGQRRLKCFIDALDECDEQEVREMIDFFEDLGQKARANGTELYICFASRHYPAIDIQNGRRLVLEDEVGHAEDLAKYVRSHLRAGKGKYIEEVRTEIQDKANGVFMWAVLVVNILNKEFRDGRIFAVRKRLQETPLELSDLFKDNLEKRFYKHD